MAVHKNHPGLTVAIVTRGRNAREYDDVDTSDGDKIIAKYIQAYANAEFMVMVTFDVPFPAARSVVLCIWVDGKVIARLVISSMKRKRPMEFVYNAIRKVGDKENLGRKLVFGALNIEEGPGDLTEDIFFQSVNSLGQIRVTVAFAEISESQKDQAGRDLPQLSSISEQVLKGEAKSLSARLGAPVLVSKPHTRKTDNKEEIADFRFIAQSVTDLQKLRIIPPSPIPPRPNMIPGAPAPPKASSRKPRSDESISRQRSRTAAVAHAPTPVPTPPPAYTPVDPSGAGHDAGGLTNEDLIALLSHYRGNSNGLQGQNRARLLIMLSHYEGKAANPAINVKREREDDVGAVEDVKRSKPEPEVIVIDDN
ncbi:hypothetical protein E8E11_011610 [Didymella keratinophila]|nr:hypothetical protein E8E11_011610 [Didymella keratinophila]